MAVAPATADAGAVAPSPARLRGWGGGAGVPGWVLRADRAEALGAALELFRARARGPDAWPGLIARGMGRSYGDAAQLEGGLALDTTGLKGLELDPERGTVTAGAGVTIGELLERAVPAGWMVPVVPGTQHVTVGGAIASDIHGKNHGTAGTFGTHVASLELLMSSGELVELSPGGEDGLFEATVGGMGLTGAIVSARISLAPVSSPLLSVDTDRVRDLDHALQALTQRGGPYRVAWLDLLGSRPGRGIVTRAAHLPRSDVPSGACAAVTVNARVAVPARWPERVLRPSTVRAFNQMRYQRAPASERGRVEPIGRHMFPLDGLEAWPRLYGRHGLLQYQLVVPYGSEHVLEAVIAELRRGGIPCYLAVLKDLGDANAAPLSFPLAGWTLALDLPRTAPGLAAVLDRCDERVAQAGGRVYLTKDARMRPEAVRTMYPRLEEWRAVRGRADPDLVWRSDLAVRTGLVAPAAMTGSAQATSAPAIEPRATVARRVLLIGGTSEIGNAIVRELAREGPVRTFLLGRDRDGLNSAAAALEQSGLAPVDHDVVDAGDLESHEEAIARAFTRAGGFDIVVMAIGVLGGQAGLDAARGEALEVMSVNFLGSGSLLLATLHRLREQRHGTVIVLSSVAAERPRTSNAIYGAAKAGLDALAQGLADGLASSGVRVLVVRPGFVRTRMTQGLKPAPFATTPELVAAATGRALKQGAHTVWVPRALRYVFAVLRHVPRPIYRRLPL